MEALIWVVGLDILAMLLMYLDHKVSHKLFGAWVVNAEFGSYAFWRLNSALRYRANSIDPYLWGHRNDPIEFAPGRFARKEPRDTVR